MESITVFQVPIVTENPFAGFYLDMDGVVADFNGLFHEITGKWPHEVTSSQLWKTINAHGSYFYSLKMMEDAHVLWEYTKQFNPTFLTGLPSKQGSAEQKQRWIAEKFGPEHEVIVLPKKLKQTYAGPRKVLIDDSTTNIDQWAAAGGDAIYHDGDAIKTIDKVEELRKSYL
jgi:5'(3')-deoxyribonucleotidase